MWVESNGLVSSESLQFFRVQAFDKKTTPLRLLGGYIR